MPYHRNLVSSISIFSAYSWSNFKIRDSFGKLKTCRFQNCPWFWNLTKIWWRKWGNKHWWLFSGTRCICKWSRSICFWSLALSGPCFLVSMDESKDRRSRMRHLNPKDIRLLSASPAYEELSAPFYPSNQITISFSGAKCARIVFCRCAFIQTQITKREMEQTKLQFQIQMNR